MDVPQKILKKSYHMVQQFHFWVYTQGEGNRYLKEKSAFHVRYRVIQNSQDI